MRGENALKTTKRPSEATLRPRAGAKLIKTLKEGTYAEGTLEEECLKEGTGTEGTTVPWLVPRQPAPLREK
jgi:hypothetical protein